MTALAESGLQHDDAITVEPPQPTTYEGTERRYVDLLLVASASCPLG